MEEKNISEQESLQIITQMIAKAKHSFHESGTSAILWGSVVAVCGLVSFAEMNWDVNIGFDIWLLTLAAIVPQVIISIREHRQRRVLSHTEAAMGAIWLVYGMSIFALVFYFNTAPHAVDRTLATEGRQVYEIMADGSRKAFHLFVPSQGTLLLLLYAIPTLSTGIAHKFKPMIVGAALCYVFLVISCFVPTAYDMLLNGLAGIFNWLIPGLILRRRYLREKKAVHV